LRLNDKAEPTPTAGDDADLVDGAVKLATGKRRSSWWPV
jgi:hypothetical protein